jgi:general L-amino acid transport system permease protein
MTADTQTPFVKPPAPPKPIQWLHENLFGTWYNTLLTVLALLFLVYVLRGIISWALFEANWDPITHSLKLFAVGQYPTAQVWRAGAVILLLSFLLGLSGRGWGGTVRTLALSVGSALGVAALLPVSMPWMLRLWFLLNPTLIWLGYQAGRTLAGRTSWLVVSWLGWFAASLVLLAGFKGATWLPRVETNLWGGLLLTFLLALVGIVASLPLGILLALGRRSKLPVLKVFCIGFIETVRGVPLVTILFMASIILPLFLPDNIRVDRVLRALIGITLFDAAYMAENIRGGLQAIPRGQWEAAKAVGLNGFQTMGLIVLPQALRLVIPAIIGQFIAIFMDTTLAIIVGLLELLAVGRTILESNVEWKLLNMEIYIFIAVVFWVFNYAMSYAGRRLEVTLGVGKR